MCKSGSKDDTEHVLLVLAADSAVRNSLKFYLEVEGFEVRSYASPSELLDDDDLPNLGCLIVEYDLPETNGLSILARLRERRNSMLGIVAADRLTDDIHERAIAAAAVLIETPLGGTKLVEHVRTLLDRPR